MPLSTVIWSGASDDTYTHPGGDEEERALFEENGHGQQINVVMPSRRTSAAPVIVHSPNYFRRTRIAGPTLQQQQQQHEEEESQLEYWLSNGGSVSPLGEFHHPPPAAPPVRGRRYLHIPGRRERFFYRNPPNRPDVDPTRLIWGPSLLATVTLLEDEL
ncbi:hypothetical protein PG999_007088 [Apiospora kogelbergensis]|uniref:Uncharacterized protein n=2 Tax=Apiospora kogelbergensis TaxID=1337665 RepID=A0AAW0QXA9_9PEZI